MTTLLVSIRKYIPVFLVAVFLAFYSGNVCYAQLPTTNSGAVEKYIGDDMSSGDSLSSVLGDIKRGLFGILEALVIIAALGAIVFAVIQMLQGERSALKRIFLWVAGLTLGFAFLNVLENLSVSTTGGTGAFSAIKGLVSETLQMVFIMASGICVVMATIHILKGEQDGLPKLYSWLIASMVGLLLLKII